MDDGLPNELLTFWCVSNDGWGHKDKAVPCRVFKKWALLLPLVLFSRGTEEGQKEGRKRGTQSRITGKRRKQKDEKQGSRFLSPPFSFVVAVAVLLVSRTIRQVG